jgi:hypothetical protein
MSYKTTFVTCLFNCHRDSGFNHEANNYYFKNSVRTMLIEEPLVIYCDPEYVHKYTELRKLLGYEHITTVIPFDYKTFSLYKYKDHITSFKNFQPDAKLNADLYIIWFSRFEMMLKTMDYNFYNSSHFCWIDINLLTKPFSNSINYLQADIYDKLSEIAKNPRDRFAIQTINCWNNNDYANLDAFFSRYQWIVSCCFYTIEMETGKFILPKLLEKTEELLQLRYCQSDESIFAFIIDNYGEHFNLYLGDYQDTIHNYFTVTSNHGYVNWVISLYYQKNQQKRLKNILMQYKEYYASKKLDFPYQEHIDRLNSENV